MPASRALRASRSPWRLELSRPISTARAGAQRGAGSSGSPEAAAFEKEYPGASWLSARVFRELETVGALAEALIAAVARRHDLSHAGLNALAVIEGNGTAMTAGAVGAHMHITSGTVTSLLDTLERKGYVERFRDSSDRRRVLVDVTPEAQDVLDRLLPEVVQMTTEVVADFSERELNDVLTLLTRLREAIDAAPNALEPPAPRRTPRALKRT